MKRLYSRQAVKAQFPKDGQCKLAIVGEAPGESEAKAGKPFVGSSGRMLDEWLEAVGIKREECLITNVFTERPKGNEVAQYFVKSTHERANHKLPKHESHGYLDTRYNDELERLRNELVSVSPRVVLAVGGTALWALTGHSKITKVRGTVLSSTLVPGAKVVGTFHPSFIMRGNDKHVPTVLSDIRKAWEFAGGTRQTVSREVWINPTLKDLELFEEKYLANAEIVCYDIETFWQDLRAIKCIGIAADSKAAIVVPFVDERYRSYWTTAEQEVKAWLWVKRILENPATKKLAHNTVYDASWLYDMGIIIQGEPRDSMLLAHAIDPERKKDLGFLGSLYSNEEAWKTMVKHSRSNKGNE